MHLTFGAVALLVLFGVPALGQRPIGPRLVPSGVSYAPPSTPLGPGAHASLRLSGSQEISYSPADSNEGKKEHERVVIAGLVGASIGAWIGYNKDRHSNEGYIPHGGLIGDGLLGMLIGVNMATIYNAVTRRRS